MRVLMVSKALVTGVYQKKLEELAALPDIELRAIVPPHWEESRVGPIKLNPQFTAGYELHIEPMRFNGRHHVHYYPGLTRQIRDFRPDIVHIDEEPYNYVAAHATWLARRAGAETLFFTWQNLLRRYPPPFRLFELYNYRSARMAIAGNRDAARVLRRKGFRKPIVVIPQFGVDPKIYRPIVVEKRPIAGPTIGYIGRIVPEKGIDTLISAVAKIPSRPTLRIIGAGDSRLELELLAERLGVRDRVRFQGGVPADRIPEVMSELDMLVVPSRTRPNWKEQFGRVLIEAMACQVPVIGSDSGEIPNVIGEAGLIFQEGDVNDLASCIRRLVEDEAFRDELGRAGRQRVLDLYTQQQVAAQTYRVYQEIMAQRESPRREPSIESPARAALERHGDG